MKMNPFQVMESGSSTGACPWMGNAARTSQTAGAANFSCLG